ncbi:YhcN/YlaJ family sporulation lipoprotein [Brevibacillus sp. TJ4]|uniref:YhcN/YlaJ family sporulation lipoprotein n=1 Tax=Brevibacillus sp. TJ4 TaxID=3234853 RepID=UPI003B9EB974
MKKAVAVLLAGLLIVSGCNTNNDQSQQQGGNNQQQGGTAQQQGTRTKQQGQAKTNQQGGKSQQQGAKTQQAQKRAKNREQRVQIASKSATSIAQLQGVQRAHVLVTNRNAYVACVLQPDQAGLSPALENQIANQVRAVDPSIERVYVSTNPEFVARVNRYVTDVQEGRPITGFGKEFRTMIQRVFPMSR